jgi:hypothetical protein
MGAVLNLSDEFIVIHGSPPDRSHLRADRLRLFAFDDSPAHASNIGLGDSRGRDSSHLFS